jgi:hypothetical protein
MTESLEQIAERIARETLSHRSTIWIRAEILAALREAEKCGEQRVAKLGGTLLDSAVERAEKAEAGAEVGRLTNELHGCLAFDAPIEEGMKRVVALIAAVRAEEREKLPGAIACGHCTCFYIPGKCCECGVSNR